MSREEQSVNGIVMRGGGVLLVRRRDVPVWVLPGGGIDRGESPEEAVCREVEEETGYRVSIARKIGRYTPLCRLARVTHLFACTIESGEATLTNETSDIAFFPLNALPERIPPPYPDWIADAVTETPGIIEKPITSVTYGRLLYYLCTHPILVARFLLTKIGIRIQ